MLFKKKDDPITAFWQWFASNSNQLSRVEDAQDKLFIELSKRLTNIHPSLVFELSGLEDGSRDFVLSADGIKPVIQTVQVVVDSAPALAGWRIVAFRQRHDELGSIEFDDIQLKLSDIYFFNAHEEGDKISFDVTVKDLPLDDKVKAAVFIMLDGLLGEYDVMTKVGSIEFREFEQANTTAQPLIELRKLVDTYPR